MPKVSVLIPTHNRVDLLRGAITSVLRQSFQDFELIVIDDGSRDGTADAVAQIADKRIRLLRHPEPRGGSAARNTGVQNSTTEYVAFLDDDDEWYPEKLRLQVELLDRSPAEVGVIYCGWDEVDSGTGRTVVTHLPSYRGDLLQRLLQSNPVGGTSTVLARRLFFEIVVVLYE
jgi:glycosyltransferase involved in cell wall biosynthesis